MATDFEMISLEEFAQRMGVCRNTVRNWISTGKLVAGEHYIWDGCRYYRFPWSHDLVMRIHAHWNPLPRPKPELRSQRGRKQRPRLRA